MELKKWIIKFKPEWDIHFSDFDNETKKRVIKKINQMEQPLRARGLHSARIKVEEVGQYRIAFFQDEEKGTKEIHFVGNHKQYEKWYKSCSF